MKFYKKGDKKLLNAWAFYDWANSVYPLVISTAMSSVCSRKSCKKLNITLCRAVTGVALQSRNASLDESTAD